jgi:large subunit ribosomal protein L21e
LKPDLNSLVIFNGIDLQSILMQTLLGFWRFKNMVKRSKGSRSKTRYKLSKTIRVGRTNPITKKIQTFDESDIVHIIIDPSIHKGQPHPRFHGKTGKVEDKRGSAYIVEINDGNKAKKLIIRPEHLKMQE